MLNKKTLLLLISILHLVFLRMLAADQKTGYKSDMEIKKSTTKEEIKYNILPKAGKKCSINKEMYFIYEFNKKPAMGMVILKIKLFNNKDKRIQSLNITGYFGMPDMNGAHDSGEVQFKLNKKGDYLMPVNLVMPGEWAIKLNFIKDKKMIYRGLIKFNV